MICTYLTVLAKRGANSSFTSLLDALPLALSFCLTAAPPFIPSSVFIALASTSPILFSPSVTSVEDLSSAGSAFSSADLLLSATASSVALSSVGLLLSAYSESAADIVSSAPSSSALSALSAGSL